MSARTLPIKETEAFLKQHALLGKVDVVLEHFDQALASNGWLENDALEDQMPAQPKTEADKQRRNTIATTFVTGNDGNAPAPFIPDSNAEEQREQEARKIQIVEPVKDVIMSEPLHDAPPPPPSEVVQPRRYELRSRAKANEPSGQQPEETPKTEPRYLTRSRARPEVTRGTTKEAAQSRIAKAPKRGRPRQKAVVSKPATRSKTARRK